MADSSEFKGIRAVLWPIHKEELKKFLPMALMMFSILFNYSLLRINKDSLVVTAAGAEVISALKLWAVLPSAMIFMVVYAKLANILSKPKLFYSIALFFLVFFGVFGFILYPLGDSLYINVASWIEAAPSFKWIFMMISIWPRSLFYIMSELWGSVMLSLMFWQFANQITPVLQAKRFYAMFGFVGNTGLILSGGISKWVKNMNPVTANYVVIVAIIAFGALAMFLYSWMQKNVLTDPKCYNPEEIQTKKKKAKLSLGESFKYIFTSKYIMFIALLVICYGISINLVEGVWKDQLKQLCPDEGSYRSFMGGLQIWTAVGTILFMIVGTNIVRIFGWFTGAMATPLMVLVTGALFFLLITYRDSSEAMVIGMGFSSALELIAYMGLLQNVLAKATKYSLFDSTKEMSYIPLDEELKMKGKAAVDVVGGRLGKSGGAAVQALLLMIPGTTLTSLVPVMSVVFVVIVLVWIFAVVGLNKEFSAKTNNIANK